MLLAPAGGVRLGVALATVAAATCITHWMWLKRTERENQRRQKDVEAKAEKMRDYLRKRHPYIHSCDMNWSYEGVLAAIQEHNAHAPLTIYEVAIVDTNNIPTAFTAPTMVFPAKDPNANYDAFGNMKNT